MEWLEFNGWSQEIERRFAHQVARKSAPAQKRPDSAPAESAQARAARLQKLLQHYPRTNPWGHPSAEC